MSPSKPTKSVSEMAVLKDIRGLLSSSPARPRAATESKTSQDPESRVVQLESQLEERKQQVGQLRREIEGLRKQVEGSDGLAANLRATISVLESDKKEQAERLNDQIDSLQQEVKRRDELSAKLQTTIGRLETEKNELEATFASLQSAGDKPTAPAASPVVAAKPTEDSLSRDIFDLEARKDELSSALTDVEGLLQIKIKDLARRIARVYEEAGDYGANRDFRRITNQLEVSENFGEFLRALLRE